MFRYTNTVREVARHIDESVRMTIRDDQSKFVEQEPAFTERLLTRIQDRLNGKTIRGIQWQAKTLTDRGRGSQEYRYGADFFGVLNIDLQDYKIKKGFLAQAKKIRRTDPAMNSDQYDFMKQQCERMLHSTPDSFVFLYGDSNINIIPASSIIAAKRCNPHELYSKTIIGFFISYLECFIGDSRIQAPSIQQLDLLLKKYEVQHTLSLVASEPKKSIII